MEDNFKKASQLLANKAEEVARHLFPAGKKVGNEWCVGDITGVPGESLKIHLTGSKAGIWGEFNGEGKGDLIELWSQARKIPKYDALQQAASFLGILLEEKKAIKPSKTVQTTQKKFIRPQCIEGTLIQNGSPVYNYVVNERKISPIILEKYNITQHKREIGFPFFRDGELIYAKYLSIDRKDNKKRMRTSINGEPCLFGWQHIPDTISSLIICEGEIDALSLREFKIPAVSVPMGAGKGKQAWLMHDAEKLKKYEKFYLCFDPDDAGKASAIEVANSLGKERCHVVTFPHKDPNECLINGMTREEMFACFEKAPLFKDHEYNSNVVCLDKKNSNSFEKIVLSSVEEKEIEWLWNEHVAYGKITLIAGEPGIGKSQLLLYIASIVSNGGLFNFENVPCKPGKVLLFSGEDNASDTVVPRLTALGASLENIHLIKGRKAFTSQGAAFYKNPSIIEDILSIEDMIKHEKYSLAIFDPLSLYLGDTDENNNKEVRAALSLLSDMAERTNTAVILNSHFSKPSGNIQKNAIYRVMGSLGFVAAARIAIAIAKDPDDPARRLFLPIKSNISNDRTGYVYKIENAISKTGKKTSMVEWLEEKISTTANEILNQTPKTRGKKIDESIELLEQILAKGPTLLSKVISNFKQYGLSMWSLYQAKGELKVSETVSGLGKNSKIWSLPPTPT